MRRLTSGMRWFGLLLVVLLFGATVLAQVPAQGPRPPQESAQKPAPTLKGGDPKPTDATTAIIAAFGKYEVVGMGAGHGDQDLDHFIFDLLRNPALLRKINDVAVECGNSLYQPILDRYIAGEDVPLDQIRQVWRNTTQPMCSISGFYEELFPLIRRMNQKLTPEARIRVLACDPPVDWGKVRSREDFMPFLMTRDASIASVMESEVLSKHRKALMLFGAAHLYHSDATDGGFKSAVGRYEEKYPGLTMVIESGNMSLMAQYNDEFESRAASWRVPSLVQDLRGTWLADWLNKTRNPAGMAVVTSRTGRDGQRIESLAAAPSGATGFSKKVDAYLYLGPQELLLKEPRSAEICLNKEYMAELQRRATVMGRGPITDQANPENVSDRDYDPFLYDEMLKRMSAAAPMPRGQRQHREIAVNTKLFDGYVGKYQLAEGLIVTITRESDRLLVQVANQPAVQLYPESERDYFLKDVDAQISFVTDAYGRATELVLHQGGDHVAKRIAQRP